MVDGRKGLFVSDAFTIEQMTFNLNGIYATLLNGGHWAIRQGFGGDCQKIRNS